MISTRIKDVDMVFEMTPSIFSPNSIDNGTLAMVVESEKTTNHLSKKLRVTDIHN